MNNIRKIVRVPFAENSRKCKNGVKKPFYPHFYPHNSRTKTFFDIRFSQDDYKSFRWTVCTISEKSVEWFFRKVADNLKMGWKSHFTPFLPHNSWTQTFFDMRFSQDNQESSSLPACAITSSKTMKKMSFSLCRWFVEFGGLSKTG